MSSKSNDPSVTRKEKKEIRQAEWAPTGKGSQSQSAKECTSAPSNKEGYTDSAHLRDVNTMAALRQICMF